MTEALILLSAYAQLVNLTAPQQAEVARIASPDARTASAWSAVCAQILANPISHWELDTLEVPTSTGTGGGVQVRRTGGPTYPTSTLEIATGAVQDLGNAVTLYTPYDFRVPEADRVVGGSAIRAGVI